MRSIDKITLKNLIPINSLHPDRFRQLLHITKAEFLPPGETIFKKGESDGKSVYLLQGKIRMLYGKFASVMNSKSTEARHPLAHRQPRPCTALTLGNTLITRIDNNLLADLSEEQSIAGIEVGEIDPSGDEGIEQLSSDDWMTNILHSEILQRIPIQNIQHLLTKIRERYVERGSVILRQGDVNDQFYIIKKGRCKVSRILKTGKVVLLSSLKEGDYFGEEALLSNTRCNANVIMSTNGILMSLSKKTFDRLSSDSDNNLLDYKDVFTNSK